jgi:hypothetical protein
VVQSSSFQTEFISHNNNTYLLISVVTFKNSLLGTLYSIFPHFKAKFDANTLFFKFCHFLCAQTSQVKQHTLVVNKMLLNNHVLQPYSKQDVTQRVLLYLHIAAAVVVVVVVCASSSSVVISWSVQKLYDCTT